MSYISGLILKLFVMNYKYLSIGLAVAFVATTFLFVLPSVPFTKRLSKEKAEGLVEQLKTLELKFTNGTSTKTDSEESKKIQWILNRAGYIVSIHPGGTGSSIIYPSYSIHPGGTGSSIIYPSYL